MISGKMESASTISTAGMTNTRGAHWSAKAMKRSSRWLASVIGEDRGVPPCPLPDREGAGPVMSRRDCAWQQAGETRSLFDAERGAIGLQLGVLAELVRDLVPARLDVRRRLVDVDLAGEQARDGGVEDDLLVALVLRHAQVEHHVRAVQAVLDGAEIVVCRRLAHASLLPQ